MVNRSGTTPDPAKPKPAKEQISTGANVKETIESILVAFILAFIFRAFIVEAFVIPTGSMAPTLLGAHMRFRCPDCGYEFAVGYSGATSPNGDDIDIPSEARPGGNIYCPNCGYAVVEHGVESSPASFPLSYGDRILVMKYAYLKPNQPQRWDVVVFKSPYDSPDRPPGSPRYQQNFIKRLIGKPRETIEILDGDVYVESDDAPQKGFQIQTRPPEVQSALWRIVYDNDFIPHLDRSLSGGAAWKQPWTVKDGSGWNLGSSDSSAPRRVFSFDNGSGSGTLWFNPDANPDTQTFSQYLVYNAAESPRRGSGDFKPVSDLKLSLYYHRRDGDGPLQLRLTKRGRTFIAEILPTGVRLLDSTGGGAPRELIGLKKFSDLGIDPVAPLFIDFMNVDYRVSLRLNRQDQDVLATTDRQYAPDVAGLEEEYRHNVTPPPPTVQIAAARQSCEISHLSLWRDISYTNPKAVPGHVAGWANYEKPIHLGDDEYFVLGDNSSNSEDARYWWEPVNLPHEDLHVESGRVPGRFMLGKAFFVYWPAGHRLLETGPAVIADFGDMRFIH